MKRIISFTLVLLCITAFGAPKAKDFTLTFDKNDFQFLSNGGKTNIKSSKYDLSFDCDTLAPALPFVFVNVLVGGGDEFDGVTATVSNSDVFDNIELAPNTIKQPNGKAETISNVVYRENEYPVKSFQYYGTHSLHGYKYMTFLVYPFRYYAQQKRLCINNSFKISISIKTIESGKHVIQNKEKREAVKRLVINGDELDALYDTDLSKHEKNLTKSSNNSYQYIIVTNNLLKPAFDRLADWKTAKGIRTKVLTTENIYQQYSGSTNQLKIKAALKDYLENETVEQQYALLGGDSNVIPVLKCWGSCNNSGNSAEYFASDYFYVCFNTMNWDTNGDGKNGTMNDNIDFSSHVAISRISANDLEQANNVINKILEYERNPKTDNWVDNMLMGGSLLSYYYQNGKSDSEVESEAFYNQYVAPYWNGSKVRFYDTATDFPGGANYDFTRDHLQEQLANGFHFVHLHTHGDRVTLQMEDDYSYGKPQASSLVNNGYSVIITNSCEGNMFDNTLYSSLCEEFMWNRNSGVISYVGGTGSVTNDMMEFSGTMLKELFTSGEHHLGVGLLEAKMAKIAACDTFQIKRYHLLCTNMLGDPETPIYLSQPLLFTGAGYIMSANSLYVFTGTNGCKICVMSIDDDSYYEVRNNVGSSTFTSPTGNFRICITKPGNIPHIIAVYNDINYLQNQSLFGNTYISTSYLLIGSNVTSSITQGPVIINDGTTEINASNYVRIENDFEIEKGAVFEINTGE